MRFLWGRGVRPKIVAGVVFALALPVAGVAAEAAKGLATETMLTAETHGLNQIELRVSVTGADGLPAHGAVVFADQGKPVAGVALDAEGSATEVLSATPGDHSLTASYAGDATHAGSVSEARPVAAVTGSAPGFSIAVAPASLSLTAGQSGTVVASVTPVNAASLTAPMFVTLSCSGLPDQASCSFSPENIQILPNTTAAVTSTMNLATSGAGTSRAEPLRSGNVGGLLWCILLPGTLSLGLTFGARRRWVRRITLLGALGLIAVLGTTACGPLYYYRNHGPSPNLPTPAGTYTLNVTAQSSNGITATTQSVSLVLTVQ